MKNSIEPKLGNNHSFLKFGLFAILLLLFLYIIDWSFLNGGITAYGTACQPGVTGKDRCYALSTPTTYYPNEGEQVVIDKGSIPIEIYKKCTVIDRKNWDCKYNDESGIFGFKNGDYHNIRLKLSDETVEEYTKNVETYSRWYYVPRFIWILESWDLI